MTMTTAQELILEGEARGREAEKIETARNLLIAILQEKFNSIPKDTERTILAMNDSIALKSWAVQASMSQTLGEFLEAFNS